MLGTTYDNKKSHPRILLQSRELQKGLDFVPRTGFDNAVELSFAFCGESETGSAS